RPPNAEIGQRQRRIESVAPPAQRPESLVHESLQSSLAAAEDGIENRELVAVDGSSRSPWGRSSIEGEELPYELADTLLRAGQPKENAGSGRPRAKRILGGTRRHQLIKAGKVPVYRAERDISALRNVGPAGAKDAFFGMERDGGVHDPLARLLIRGGPAGHSVGPRRHD